MENSHDTRVKRAPRSLLLKVALSLTAFVGLCVLIDALFFANEASLMREGGGLELSAAILFAATAVVFIVIVPRVHWVELAQIPILMLLFAMRELDLDKAFTSSGILSLRFYSGDSSLTAKIIGGAFVGLTLWAMARVVLRGVGPFLRGLRSGEVWAYMIAIAVFLTFSTKMIDGLGRKLAPLGIEVSATVEEWAFIYEEIGESFIAVFVILALVDRWKRRAA